MKFSTRAYPPSFFDLSQDISRELPADVIAEWTAGDQSEKAAKAILGKKKVVGTAVSSDSAGLTKMSMHTGLIEMLAKINRPKELVYSYGTHVGGQGVGIWAADNTEMFYPDSVRAEEISSMLLALQDHVKKECEVQIGLGAHYGEFYSLGGGLYGPDADWIENVAENFTSGGEIVATGEFLSRLAVPHSFEVAEREDLRSEMGKVFRLAGGPDLAAKPAIKHDYPIPYSKGFYEELIAYEASGDSALLESLYKKYTQTASVVLVERESEEDVSPEVRLLNDLALSVVMKNAAKAAFVGNPGIEIKIAGNLGIYTFADCPSALAFAKALRAELLKADVRSKIGVDCGDLLVFDTPDKRKDIAGMPVNRASKMAQDKGELGNIYMTDTAGELSGTEGFSPVVFEVSGVELNGYVG